MSRLEVINSWFSPAKVRIDGIIQPAPREAMEKYMELRTDRACYFVIIDKAPKL